MMEVWVEKHVIRSSDPLYIGFLEDANAGTHLYNRTIYILRQAFTDHHENIQEYADLIGEEKFISYENMVKRMAKLGEPVYKALKSQVAQKVVKEACKAFFNFFAALRSYKKNPKVFTGRPKMPKPKDSKSYRTLTYDYQAARLQKDGTINISKTRKLPLHTNLTKFKEMKLVPKHGCIIAKISYEKPLEIIDGLQFDKVAAGDMGVNNLMAITSNDGSICSLVNGRPLKFINYRYNKDLAKLQKHHDSEEESKRYRKRLDAITRKRDFRVDDCLHKASRLIVNALVKNRVARCFIGLNWDWKQRCKMKHHTKQMQNFQQVAFSQLVWMIQYKAALYGIEVTTLKEDHTSKCSYYDDEAVCHHSSYAGVRAKRGCFITEEGRILNADINASLNILKRGQGSHFGFHQSFFNPKIVNPDAPVGARACRMSGRIPNPC